MSGAAQAGQHSAGRDGDSWLVPASVFECEQVLKKSRFIARVVPVADRAEVNQALALARRDYPDARHHCWAYLLGRPRDAAGAGMSDDGEPSGTAGKPILNVLQHGEVGDVLIVVVRYFGGIKLGAGGLVRAYGGAAQQALAQAPLRRCRALQEVTLYCPFSGEPALRRVLAAAGAEIEGVDYAQGARFRVLAPLGEIEPLLTLCAARGDGWCCEVAEGGEQE